MKRKIITTIVILLIAVVVAVIYGTFFATERPLNCCHGEQYDLKKEYVNDKYGFRFQYPAQFSENIEHDNLENAYASIAVHVIDKAINGFNDFTDAGAKGHRLVTNDNKDIEFLGLDENNFVEKNIGDYKLYTFEDKTFATSYYALIVKEKMSVLVGVNPLNRNVQSDDILKMVRQDIISSFKFTPLETAIDTSNWKTYSDEKYGFEFKYPNNFEVFTDQTENVHVVHPEDKGADLSGQGPLDGLWIYTIDNKDGLSAIDWWNKKGPYTTKESLEMGVKPDSFPIEKITVDGVDGVYIGGSKGVLSNFIILKQKDKIIEMNLMASDSMKILSTFKFTPLETAIDTSNWKTYRNEKYGFEFKYPPMQSISEKNNQISLIQNRAGSDAGITMSFEFSNLDLKQFVEEYKKEIFPYNTAPILKQENYSYNGTEGVRLLVNNAMDFPTYYFFYNKGETSLIVHYKGSEQEKILSTFKFTK